MNLSLENLRLSIFDQTGPGSSDFRGVGVSSVFSVEAEYRLFWNDVVPTLTSQTNGRDGKCSDIPVLSSASGVRCVEPSTSPPAHYQSIAPKGSTGSHNRQMEFNCDKCDKSFRNRSTLNKHRNRNHETFGVRGRAPTAHRKF